MTGCPLSFTATFRHPLLAAEAKTMAALSRGLDEIPERPARS